MVLVTTAIRVKSCGILRDLFFSRIPFFDSTCNISSLRACLSTDHGYAQNSGKTSNGLQIPLNKMVLGIPATESATGGEITYVATPEDIKCLVTNAR
jgi:hypothetical protein